MLEARAVDSSEGNSGLLFTVPFGSDFRLPMDGDPSLPIVIDAAASLGNLPTMRELPQSSVVVFSLHATKILGCGEGALVVFGTSERAEAFRAWQNFGFRGSREAQFAATNAKLPEVSAAYALAALDEWPQIRHSWEESREQALAISIDLGLDLAPQFETSVSPYWMVRLPDAALTVAVEAGLAEAGIQTRRWWPKALNEMTAFARFSNGGFPNSERLSRSTLGLPHGPHLSRPDYDRIWKQLKPLVRKP